MSCEGRTSSQGMGASVGEGQLNRSCVRQRMRHTRARLCRLCAIYQHGSRALLPYSCLCQLGRHACSMLHGSVARCCDDVFSVIRDAKSCWCVVAQSCHVQQFVSCQSRRVAAVVLVLHGHRRQRGNMPGSEPRSADLTLAPRPWTAPAPHPRPLRSCLHIGPIRADAAPPRGEASCLGSSAASLGCPCTGPTRGTATRPAGAAHPSDAQSDMGAVILSHAR